MHICWREGPSSISSEWCLDPKPAETAVQLWRQRQLSAGGERKQRKCRGIRLATAERICDCISVVSV